MDSSYWNDYWLTHQEKIIDGWKTLLRFKSVSADPAFHADCSACVSWLGAHLSGLGFSVTIIPTSGREVLLAEYKGIGVDASKPAIIFYGHYDVQPADPLDEWQSDPFEPELRDGRLYARGAEDNKGQLWYVLSALEALIVNRLLTVPVTLLIEGEEECGSNGLTELLTDGELALQAEALLVCDSFSDALDKPTILLGLRGLIALEVVLRGAHTDLHSGVHGGLLKNPALELCRLIARCFDDSGAIAIPGFYDDVRLPTEAELKRLEATPFDEALYRRQTGMPATGGESNLLPRIREGFRPTLEINGLVSGYTQSGVKTIIPREARVKLTARVSQGQDPARILSLIENFFRDHAPENFKCEITLREASGPAIEASVESPFIADAASVLQEYCGGTPIYRWCGASIPFVSLLAKATKSDPVLVGFGLEEDKIHAPNESFSLEQFRLGFLYSFGIFPNNGASRQ